MSSVNKVIIIGNLGADPEVRQFSNGGSVTSISIATSEKWTDKNSGEKKELTEWHRVSMFNKLGEIAAKYLRKGSKVYIEGSLRTTKYQAQDGSDRYSTDIRAAQMTMLDSKGESQQGDYQQPQPQQSQQAPNPYAQQMAQNAQGMRDTIANQFAQQGQNPAMNGGGVMDENIPFIRHFDGI